MVSGFSGNIGPNITTEKATFNDLEAGYFSAYSVYSDTITGQDFVSYNSILAFGGIKTTDVEIGYWNNGFQLTYKLTEKIAELEARITALGG